MKNFKFCFHYQEDWRLVNINYSQICDAAAADEKTNTRCEKQKKPAKYNSSKERHKTKPKKNNNNKLNININQ